MRHPALAVPLALALIACDASQSTRASPKLDAPPADSPLLQTDSGKLSGKTVPGGVRAFLGIPYAAPPTGPLRWRPPAQVAPWPGVRDATRHGPACVQLDGDERLPGSAEDCLTLDVWTPAGGAANKPVFVWFPGGAFVQGSGSFALYDGARLAAREDAVVVTLNYRLGPLGFLAHPELAREAGRDASPSYGLLDQRAAMHWVQRNARAFGGDPSNVTIFGESAGAWSVCAHLAMPGSRGLFARAIMQSGACADPLYFGPREAEAQGARLAAMLGCADLACLRGKDAEAVVRALPVKRAFVLPPGVWWAPVVDGTELPAVPLEALRAGRGANVPLIIGWNRDEGVLHTVRFETVTPAEADSFVRDSFGEPAVESVAKRYARATPKESLTDVITDGVFACESRRVARVLASQGVPVYLYELTRALDHPKAHKLGATHSIDLWFVFGTMDGGIGLSYDELPLSGAIQDAWGRFARTGNPDGAGLPWPRYTVERDQNVVLDVVPSIGDHLKAEECDFWDRFQRLPR
jgi:para-nitrobenzyl esterase